MSTSETLEARVERLQKPGVVDMHYDLMTDLYDKRARADVLTTDYLADLQAGGIGVVGSAIYIEDTYLPEMGLRVALDQIARLYAEVDRTEHFAICRSYHEICRARAAGRIALVITMEGVEPLGSDLDLLRVFYELGLRMVGLTHSRRNAAGDGGVFAQSGSPRDGLTTFGRAVVAQCEALGIIVDLAHISPAGFDDVLAVTTRPVVISHTNARKYYDIERNVSDEQIRAVGQRRGVIGVNSVLVSGVKEDSHLDRYVDHVEHIASLIGMGAVAIGFDFFESIYNALPAAVRAALPNLAFIDGLTNHSHARNLTRRLIERGFSDDDVEKILYGNWMRILKELL